MQKDGFGLALVRAVAFLVIALLALLILGAGVGAPARGIRSLEGTWPATLRTGEQVDLQIPGLLDSQGLDGDPELTIHIPVELDTAYEEPALYLSGLRYAAELRWDGRLLGKRGDPDAGRWSDESLLLCIPGELATQGTHRLDLRLRGAFGEGGIVGSLLLGEREELTSYYFFEQMQDFGLALGSGILALVYLLVAFQRPRSRLLLYFGLSLAALAFFWLAESDAWFHHSPSLDLRLRVRRAAYLLFPAFALLWASHFAFRRSTRLARAYALACGALAALAAFWPDLHVNADVNEAGDYLVYVFLLVLPYYLFRARPDERVSARLLAFAGLVAAVGITWDITVTRGLATRHHMVFLLFSTAIVVAAVAITLKHVDTLHRFTVMSELSPEGILVLDREGGVITANPRAREIFALGDEQEPDFAQTLREEHREGLLRHLREIALHGSSRWEFQIRRQSGSYWYESLGVPLEVGRALLVVRDVTASHRLDAGLQRAARMETFALLARPVMIELQGLVEGLRSALRGIDPQGERGSLRESERLLMRARDLLRRTLSLSQQAPPEQVPLEYTELLRSTVEQVRRLLPDGVVLEAEIPETPIRGFGAADELEEAFIGLLVNAVEQVSHKQGRVVVSLRLRNAGAGEPSVLVVVEDNGPGIPEEQREQVFDITYSTRRGLGLGLPLLKKVVEDHGGVIQLDESPLGGARFSIELPLQPSPASSRVERVAKTVLLVDISETRGRLEAALERRGYRVVVASRVDEARRRWEERDGGVDLLAIEALLPDGSGVELARELEEQRPGLKVLVISEFVGPEQIPAVQAGRWRYLPRPFRVAQFTAVVDEVLRT